MVALTTSPGDGRLTRRERGIKTWNTKLNDELVGRIRAAEGSLADIAEQFSLSMSCTQSALTDERWNHVGLPRAKRLKRVEKYGAQWNTILKLHEEGVSQSQIGKRLGIPRATIGNILRRAKAR